MCKISLNLTIGKMMTDFFSKSVVKRLGIGVSAIGVAPQETFIGEKTDHLDDDIFGERKGVNKIFEPPRLQLCHIENAALHVLCGGARPLFLLDTVVAMAAEAWRCFPEIQQQFIFSALGLTECVFQHGLNASRHAFFQHFIDRFGDLNVFCFLTRGVEYDVRRALARHIMDEMPSRQLK